MSTSIFSPFEALSADYYFGQKVAGFSCAPPPPNTNKHGAAAAAETVVNSSSMPTTKKPEDRRRIRAPRLAPELDGIYCFETLLPY
ncbi:hypothetical protein ABFS83_11G059100 [Erythranthe nasuta]